MPRMIKRSPSARSVTWWCGPLTQERCHGERQDDMFAGITACEFRPSWRRSSRAKKQGRSTPTMKGRGAVPIRQLQAANRRQQGQAAFALTPGMKVPRCRSGIRRPVALIAAPPAPPSWRRYHHEFVGSAKTDQACRPRRPGAVPSGTRWPCVRRRQFRCRVGPLRRDEHREPGQSSPPQSPMCMKPGGKLVWAKSCLGSKGEPNVPLPGRIAGLRFLGQTRDCLRKAS